MRSTRGSPDTPASGDHSGLTRARLSQLVDLTRLAPDLQELVLALRYTPGREAITERKLRGIAATPLWSEQRWRRVAANRLRVAAERRSAEKQNRHSDALRTIDQLVAHAVRCFA